jgi:hypothetical protein
MRIIESKAWILISKYIKNHKFIFRIKIYRLLKYVFSGQLIFWNKFNDLIIYARHILINKYDDIKQQNEFPDNNKFNSDIDKFVISLIIQIPQNQSQQRTHSIEHRFIDINNLVNRLIGEEGNDNNH